MFDKLQDNLFKFFENEKDDKIKYLAFDCLVKLAGSCEASKRREIIEKLTEKMPNILKNELKNMTKIPTTQELLKRMRSSVKDNQKAPEEIEKLLKEHKEFLREFKDGDSKHDTSYRPPQFNLVFPLEEIKSETLALTVLPNGTIASGNKAGYICLWRKISGSYENKYYQAVCANGPVHALAALENGMLISARGSENEHKVEGNSAIQLWKEENRKYEWCGGLQGGRNIRALAILKDRTIVAGYKDSPITLWKWNEKERKYNAKPSQTFKDPASKNVHVLIAAEDEMVVSGHYGGAVKIWKKINGEQYSYQGYFCPLSDKTIKLEGKTAEEEYSNQGYVIKSFNFIKNIIWSSNETIKAIRALAILPSNKTIVIGVQEDKCIRLWGEKNGKYAEDKDMQISVKNPIEVLAVLKKDEMQDETIVAGDTKGIITFWRLNKTGKKYERINNFQIHKGLIRALTISSDNMIVSACGKSAKLLGNNTFNSSQLRNIMFNINNKDDDNKRKAAIVLLYRNLKMKMVVIDFLCNEPQFRLQKCKDEKIIHAAVTAFIDHNCTSPEVINVLNNLRNKSEISDETKKYILEALGKLGLKEKDRNKQTDIQNILKEALGNASWTLSNTIIIALERMGCLSEVLMDVTEEIDKSAVNKINPITLKILGNVLERKNNFYRFFRSEEKKETSQLRKSTLCDEKQMQVLPSIQNPLFFTQPKLCQQSKYMPSGKETEITKIHTHIALMESIEDYRNKYGHFKSNSERENALQLFQARENEMYRYRV